MSTANVTSTPWPCYHRGADNMASCKHLGEVIQMNQLDATMIY